MSAKDASVSKSKVSRSKSLAASKETISTVGVDSAQIVAKEAREDRRSQILKTHKYLFLSVSHYLCLSADEVEEFALDEENSLRKLIRFTNKDETILFFQYQQRQPLTFEECGRVMGRGATSVMRLFVTSGDGVALESKCVYFLKKSPAPLEDKNISDEVIAGSFTMKAGSTILGVFSDSVSRTYYPALYHLKYWAVNKHISDQHYCTYNELFVSVDDFIQHTQWAEKHVNEMVELKTLDPDQMTILAGITTVADCLAAAQSKVIISLAEEIVNLWCQQVEMLLNAAGRIRREADDIGPKKELEFWLGRTAHFSYLLQQIRSRQAKTVFHILHICKSPVMSEWRELDMKITDQANEARDNTKYLYTLEKYCEPLYRCQPINMLDKLSGLIGTIRLIYNFSPYYTSTDKVSSLFVKITNQIVTSCKNYVSDHGTTRLWDMPKNELYTRLKHCIRLFEAYINIYTRTKKKIANTQTERPFNFSEMYIFGKIHTFRNRIDKIICLLEYCNQFSSLDSCTIEGIETLSARFNSLYLNLKKKGYDLLNYKNLAFDEDFDKFQELVDDLKLQLKKFMNVTMNNLKQSSDKLDMMKRCQIDSLIFPALTTITWTSLETSNYFKELDKAFEEFSLLIKTVCDIKYTRIDAKLVQIADTLLCSLPTVSPWSVEEFLINTQENTQNLGDELNTLNLMICDTVYELLRTFVNNAVVEYKSLERIYNEEQKIGDAEC
uniref:Dynein heavy chain tail domain-containing protein n=1 Tax=Biomphalaria glabrata TaxID=6526 RepID=A0A2C9JM71_BIOGL